MFTYDLYKNRIRRIAQVKHLIKRFRVLIIVVLSLMIAALTGFLLAKGTITANVALSAQEIYYGEDYELVDAKVLFGSVKAYEYATADSDEWSTEKPTTPGKYYVRAVTRGGFGRKQGDVVAFEILPKNAEIVIRDESVVYGNNPKDIELALVGDDRLVKEDLSFRFADYAQDETQVTVDLDSVHIVSTAGEDITDYYKITAATQDIRFLTRKISVQPIELSSIFNGQPQAFENLPNEATRIELGDDEIQFNTIITDESGAVVAQPIYAGRYTVAIDPDSVRIVKRTPAAFEASSLGSLRTPVRNAARTEVIVTSHYEIEYKPTAFVIEKRPLSVVTESQTKVYDGTPLVNRNFTSDSEIAGHRVEISSLLDASQTDVGTCTNRYDFIVRDGEGRDITRNYDISSTFGTLTVTARPMTVITADKEWVYDGREQSWPEFTPSGVAPDQQVVLDRTKASAFGKITEVGNTENVLSFVVQDENGNDVTANYTVTSQFGTLTVTPRPLAVTTPSDMREYNGEPLTAYEGAIYDPVQVAPDQTLQLDWSKASLFGTITDKGTTKNVLYYIVTDNNGNPVTHNYTLTVTHGDLTVMPRRIELGMSEYQAMYDGKDHVSLRAQYSWHVDQDGNRDGTGGLLAQDYAAVSDPAEIVSLRDSGQSGITVVNTYAPSAFVVWDKDGNISGNYEVVSVTAGTITVTPRPVWIKSSSATFTYNGNWQAAEKYAVYGGVWDDEFIGTWDDPAMGEWGMYTSLAEGHTVQIGAYTSVREADTYYNVMTDVKIVDDNGHDVTDNYALRIDAGVLTVNKREIRIATGGGRWEYDGEAHYNYGEYTADNLAEGHRLQHDVPATQAVTITDYVAGGIPNAYTFTIWGKVDGKDTDVSDNYTITQYHYGTLIVTPRVIVMHTPDAAKMYDGTQLYTYDNTLSDGKVYADGAWQNQTVTTFTHQKSDGAEKAFVGSHTPFIKTLAAIVNVWESQDGNNILDYEIYADEYESVSVSANYEIVPVYGTLTVTQRTIRIYTPSAAWIYDGKAHSAPDDRVEKLLTDGQEADSPRAIVDGQAVNITKDFTVLNVSDSGANVLAYDIVAGGVSMLGNYEVDYKYGTLTILPRPVCIYSDDHGWIYDGERHSDEGIRAAYVTDYYTATDDGSHGILSLDTASGLISPHALLVSGVTYVTDVRDTQGGNNVLTYSIVNGDPDNYKIVTEIWGTLTVVPRPIEVSTVTQQWVYDGKAHSAKELTDTVIIDAEYKDGEYVTLPAPDNKDKALVDGHSFAVQSYTNITDKGTELNILRYTVIDAQNNVQFVAGEENNNYTVTGNNWGDLVILPRPIVVYTAGHTWEYDGKEHYDDSVEIAYESDHYRNEYPSCIETPGSGLVLNHTFNVTSYKTITDVQYDDRDNIIGIDNELLTYEILSGTDDISRNYVVIKPVDWGKLKITPREIIIFTPDDRKMYDGNALYTYEKTYDGKTYFDGARTDANKHVTVFTHKKSAGAEKAFVLDHEPELSGVTRIVNVWETGDKNNVLIYSVRNVEQPRNYLFVPEYGTLTITQRPIRIISATHAWIYDGGEHSDRKFTAEFLSYGTESAELPAIASGYEFVVTDSVVVTNVTDSGDNVFTYQVAYSNTGAYGEGVHSYKENYDIDFVKGTLTVLPRPITVYTRDGEWEYDGENHTTEEYNDPDEIIAVYVQDYYKDYRDEKGNPVEDLGSTATGLVSGHAFDVTWRRPVINVHYVLGQLHRMPNTFIYTIVDSDSSTMYFQGRDRNNYVVDSDEWGKLTITPRNILLTVNDHTWIYDGEEHADREATAMHAVWSETEEKYVPDAAFALVEGHSPAAQGDDVPIRNVGERENTYTYEIMGNDGVSEDTNYAIHAVTPGMLTIVPRPITVKTLFDQWEYNGKPHTTEESDDSFMEIWALYGSNDTGLPDPDNADQGLVSDHTFYITYRTAVTNVWDSAEHNNVLKYRITDGDGNVLYDSETEDDAFNYTVTDEFWGSLKITPRRIFVTTPSMTRMYDGTPLFTYENTFNGKTYVDARDVTDGYDGEDRKYVTKFSYQGGVEGESSAFVSGHEPLLIQKAEITNVWESWDFWQQYPHAGNNMLEYTVTNADGSEISVDNSDHLVAENYNLIYTHGKLIITERTVTVQSATPEAWVYDGDKHSDKTVTIAFGGDPEKEGNFALADGFAFIVHTSAEVINVSDTKVGNNEILSYDVHVKGDPAQTECDGHKYSDNYAITWENGTLTVTPRPVYVKPTDKEKTFDGESFVYDAASFAYYGLSATNEDLQMATVNGKRENLNLAVTYTDENGERVEFPVHAGTYTIAADTEHCSVTGGNSGHIGNYTLICEEFATLTIHKRPITVTAPTFTRVYSGKAVDATEQAYGYSGILDEHVALIVPVYSYYDEESGEEKEPKDAGTYIVKIDDLTAENDILADYEYSAESFSDGKLIIDRRPVTIRPNGGSKPYDGVAVSYDDLKGDNFYNVTGGSLAEGETLTCDELENVFFYGTVYHSHACGLPDTSIEDARNVTDAATYYVRFVQANWNDLNPNYDITVQDAAYTVNPLIVTVSNGDWEDTYTGKPISAPEEIETDGAQSMVIAGHYVVPDSPFQVTEAGTHTNEQSIKIVDADGNCQMHNYSVTTDKGTITIHERKFTVNVTPEKATKTYDAEPFAIVLGKDAWGTTQQGEEDKTGIASGHTLATLTWQNMTDADTYTDYKVTKFVITDGAGKDVTTNYELVYGDRPALTIEPKELDFGQLKITKRVYDGSEQGIIQDECLGGYDALPKSFAIADYIAYRRTSGGASNREPLVRAGIYLVTLYKSAIVLDGIRDNPNYLLVSSSDSAIFLIEIEKFDLAQNGVTIKTAEEEWAYDNREWSNTTIEYFGSLPSGHYVQWDHAGEAPFVIAPGEKKDNELGYAIWGVIDGVAMDVTDCFTQATAENGLLQYGELRVSDLIALRPTATDGDSLYLDAVYFETGDTVTGYVLDGRDGHTEILNFTFSSVITDIVRVKNAKGETLNEICDSVCKAGTYTVYYSSMADYSMSGKAIPPDHAEKFQVTNALPTGKCFFTFTVRPRVLFAGLNDYEELYDGTNDILTYKGETFAVDAKDVRDIADYGLAVGHVFAGQVSDTLNVVQAYCKDVTISDYRIVCGDRDCTENYTVYTSYNEALMGDSVREDIFTAELAYIRRRIYVALIAPQTDTFIYNGSEHVIPLTDAQKARHVTENDPVHDLFVYEKEDGDPTANLLLGHYMQALSAAATQMPGKKTKWLTFGVYAADGKNVINGYDIKYLYDSDGVLVVEKADLVISMQNGQPHVSATGIDRNAPQSYVTVTEMSPSSGAVQSIRSALDDLPADCRFYQMNAMYVLWVSVETNDYAFIKVRDTDGQAVTPEHARWQVINARYYIDTTDFTV